MRDVATEIRDDTLVIRFIRPEVRNPLSIVVIDEILSIIDPLDPAIKKVIFTGTDEIFASGANLREIQSVTETDAPAFAARGQRLMRTIAALKPTTIAAVNGPCYGGALDLASACDLRIASPTATFAHPGAKLGIITGWGGTQRLPRLIGSANALEMFFTGSPIDAACARDIGLVDVIADDVVAAAIELR